MKTRKLSRREFLIAAGAVAGGSLLAACGPPATEAPVEKPEPTEPPVEEPTEQPSLPEPEETKQVFAELEPPPEPPEFEGGPSWEPQDLTGESLIMWGIPYDPHVERYEILADTFSKRTGVEVEVQPQENFGDAVMGSLAAGTPPDVICYMGKSTPPLVVQGALRPVDEIAFEPLGLDVDRWWRPGSIGCYAFEGKHWGIPTEDNWDGYNVAGRIDLIAQASDAAQAIWSWAQENTWFKSYEDLFALAEELQVTADDGTVEIWGLNSNGWDQHSLLSIQRSLGQFWWDNETKTFNLDNPEMVEAIRLLCVEPFERGIEGILGMSQINAFVAGQVALARGNATTAGEAWKVDIEGENVIAPPPIEGETPLFVGEGGWGFVMPMEAPHEEAAMEFIRFMCTYEAQYIFSQIYGGSPPATWGLVKPELADIYEGDHPVKVGIRRCIKALENCIYWGNDMGVGGTSYSVFAEVTGAVREGTMTAEEGARRLQEDITEMYEQFVADREA